MQTRYKLGDKVILTQEAIALHEDNADVPMPRGATKTLTVAAMPRYPTERYTLTSPDYDHIQAYEYQLQPFTPIYSEKD